MPDGHVCFLCGDLFMKQKSTTIGLIAAGAAILTAGIWLIVRGIRAGSGLISLSVPAYSSIGGTVLILAGGILMILGIQQLRRDPSGGVRTEPDRWIPDVPPAGYIEAEIIGITRSLRVAGDEEAFHVVCRYTEAESGRSTTFTSDPVKTYPGREIIGRHVRVYPDPGEAGIWHVDLDSVT